MIVLDTNVLSALMRPVPDTAVVQWLDKQPESSIWVTSITLMEIRYGLQCMAAGRRRQRMTQEFEGLLREEIEGRYAEFDVEAALSAAELMTERKRTGRPVEIRDTMIAGIVVSRNAVLATGNLAHFADLSSRLVNPWG